MHPRSLTGVVRARPPARTHTHARTRTAGRIKSTYHGRRRRGRDFGRGRGRALHLLLPPASYSAGAILLQAARIAASLIPVLGTPPSPRRASFSRPNRYTMRRLDSAHSYSAYSVDTIRFSTDSQGAHAIHPIHKTASGMQAQVSPRSAPHCNVQSGEQEQASLTQRARGVGFSALHALSETYGLPPPTTVSETFDLT